MHYSEPLDGVHVTIHALLELWVHKGCNLYCGKSGRWYGPRSCNWGDPSYVKSTSSFFQCFHLKYTAKQLKCCQWDGLDMKLKHYTKLWALLQVTKSWVSWSPSYMNDHEVVSHCFSWSITGQLRVSYTCTPLKKAISREKKIHHHAMCGTALAKIFSTTLCATKHGPYMHFWFASYAYVYCLVLPFLAVASMC